MASIRDVYATTATFAKFEQVLRNALTDAS